jgi:hypothetical protein
MISASTTPPNTDDRAIESNWKGERVTREVADLFSPTAFISYAAS